MKFILISLALALAAPGQERIASVRVSTDPPGPAFRVDGQNFSAPATFMWPAGSKHVLTTFPVQDGVAAGTRYVFGKWLVNGEDFPQQGLEVIVTADPAISSFQAVFGTLYRVSFSWYSCAPEGPCASPGVILVDGEQRQGSFEMWAERGKVLSLAAVPNPGYVFVGWQQGRDSEPLGFMNTVTVNGPMTLTPRFEVARPVRLETSPPGLQLMVDRTPATAPATYDWGYNTTHTLAPVSPQFDKTGNLWVFRGWSDGAPAQRSFKTPPGSTELVFTAEFVPGARATFTTNPPGLKLLIDGRDSWNGSYSYAWGVGETHTAEAPAEQMDGNGRKWVFRGWSNGAPAVQEIAVTEAHAAEGLRMVAEYEVLGRLTVQASVAGLSAVVDGTTCPMPCTLHAAAGTEVRVSVPEAAPAAEGSRFEFRGWGDATTPERTVTFDAAIQVATAAYVLRNRLAMSADPPEGAAWRCVPESPDGFYDAGTSVTVEVEGRPGYRFRRLEGDLNGNFASGTLDMSHPKYVRAVFERVPYIAPAGVKNAAGETPVEAVAAGSVITIYGANLASSTEIGQESPLAQTLGGVIVRLGERLLPLFFVSPEQINAQLPSDIPEGEHTLAVKPPGAPEVRANFTVARNAPGLFQHFVDGVAWAVASRADGSAVTPETPAQRGEIVTIYGTGFGPYDRRPPDGFAVPEVPAYRLADPAEILAGETSLQPLWVGASPGRVGISAFRMRVGPDWPSGAVKLTLLVNGVESNSVPLAVE